MSKKKEINLKSTPAAVESGDVNISYNNVLVGSLSDSGSAVLKTEMTICEHDIEVEYTKQAGESFPTFTATGDVEFQYARSGSCPLIREETGGHIVNAIISEATNYIPNPTESGYEFFIQIDSAANEFDITANGNEAVYNSGQHIYDLYFDVDYDTPVVMTVTKTGTKLE